MKTALAIGIVLLLSVAGFVFLLKEEMALKVRVTALDNELHKLGATIISTNSSDTLSTFRTNVNTSLTNLNTSLGVWPFTTGLTTYSTTTQATTTPLWARGGLFASSTATIPALAVTQSGTGPSAVFLGGSVGISTGNPTTILEIASSSSKVYFSNSTNGNGFVFNAAGQNYVGMQAFGVSASNSRLSLGYTSAVTTNITEALTILDNGNVGVGTTTPIATFQVTNPSANATTSVQFGKPNQNKGTCLTYYDTAGTPVYGFITAGATAFTFTATKPSGCQN